MDDADTSASGFFREVGRDLAKTLALAVLGSIGLWIGVTNEASFEGPLKWPAILAAIAVIALLLSVGTLIRAASRWRAKSRVGRASGGRIAILLPRLIGDDRMGGKRETIREDIKHELGDAVELILWPEALTLAEGRDQEAESETASVVRDWLRRTSCDLIVWGRVRGDRVLSLRIGGAEHRPYVLGEDTLGMPKDFAAALSVALIQQALDEAYVEGRSGKARIPELKKAGQRIEALLTRVTSPEVTLGYASLLAQIGHQVGDRSLSQKGIDLTLELLESHGPSLDREIVGRAHDSVAGMLIGLAHNVRDRQLLDQASAYLSTARELIPGLRPDINYGILLCMTGERDMRPDLLHTAIAEFTAITDAQPNTFRREYVGKAWHNLGTTYVALHDLTSDMASLDLAIGAFEKALPLRDQDELYWAKTQDALGTALFSRGKATVQTDDMRRSLEHFQSAINVYVSEEMDHLTSLVTYNFGCAQSTAGGLDGSLPDLIGGIERLQAVSDRWEGNEPDRFASVQNALGTAYLNLAALTSDPEAAQIAFAAFERSRSILDPASNVEEWVGVRANEARCLTVLGVLNYDPEPLVKARTLLEDCAAKIRSYPTHPLVRIVGRNLSDCYQKLSVLEDDDTHVEKAIDLHRAAALEAGQMRDFENWAHEKLEAARLLALLSQLRNQDDLANEARSYIAEVIRKCANSFPFERSAAEALLDSIDRPTDGLYDLP